MGAVFILTSSFSDQGNIFKLSEPFHLLGFLLQSWYLLVFVHFKIN